MKFGMFLIILAAAVVGALLLSDPLYVEYAGWSIAAPLSAVLALAALALFLFVALLRLLYLALFFPARLRSWRAARRGKKRAELLEEVLRLESHRNRRALLKTLEQLAGDTPAAAWRGAVAAGKLGDAGRRQKFLELAAGGDDATIAAAAKAELCRANNRPGEAQSILKAAGAPRGETVLAEIYYEASRAREDWRAALSAAVRLREDAAPLWEAAADEAALRVLEEAAGVEEARSFWKEEISADDKKRALLHAAYLRALARLGDEKGLKDGLAQAFRREPNDVRILQLVAAFGEKEQAEAAFVANEKRAAGNDAAMLRVLAALAERLELPGKARRYVEMLNALQQASGKNSNAA